jgi:hypothetical protein
MDAASFTVSPKIWGHGWSPNRLGGWLSRRFGPVTLCYLLNAQDPRRHLNLYETKDLGRVFAESGKFLQSQCGAALLANVDAWRKQRLQRVAAYTGGSTEGEDAIQSESEVSNGVGISTPESPSKQPVEKWVP